MDNVGELLLVLGFELFLEMGFVYFFIIWILKFGVFYLNFLWVILTCFGIFSFS